MKTDHLPRHIQEHVKHCTECQKRKDLCKDGNKLFTDWKTVAARIDRLPPLKP
jgi:hypothetical protein